jgi:predicted TIM-barrel fold metal-dependent hydrolase
MGIDPMSADALSQIEQGINLGLQGVTVSPTCQGFHPSHSSAMRVYEKCAEKSLPLFVANLDPLTPNSVLEYSRPALWDEVAVAFPELPIVIGQLGHPWIDETLVMVSKHSHVFTDISGVVSRPWQLYTALLSAASLSVMDRLLFGSGFPYESPTGAIESIYSVNAFSHGASLPTIPRAMLSQIVERDSLSCLGIEAEIAQRPVPANEDSMHPEMEELAIARKPVSLSGRRMGDLIG